MKENLLPSSTNPGQAGYKSRVDRETLDPFSIMLKISRLSRDLGLSLEPKRGLGYRLEAPGMRPTDLNGILGALNRIQKMEMRLGHSVAYRFYYNIADLLNFSAFEIARNLEDRVRGHILTEQLLANGAQNSAEIVSVEGLGVGLMSMSDTGDDAAYTAKIGFTHKARLSVSVEGQMVPVSHIGWQMEEDRNGARSLVISEMQMGHDLKSMDPVAKSKTLENAKSALANTSGNDNSILAHHVGLAVRSLTNAGILRRTDKVVVVNEDRNNYGAGNNDREVAKRLSNLVRTIPNDELARLRQGFIHQDPLTDEDIALEIFDGFLYEVSSGVRGDNFACIDRMLGGKLSEKILTLQEELNHNGHFERLRLESIAYIALADLTKASPRFSNTFQNYPSSTSVGGKPKYGLRWFRTCVNQGRAKLDSRVGIIMDVAEAEGVCGNIRVKNQYSLRTSPDDESFRIESGNVAMQDLVHAKGDTARAPIIYSHDQDDGYDDDNFGDLVAANLQHLRPAQGQTGSVATTPRSPNLPPTTSNPSTRNQPRIDQGTPHELNGKGVNWKKVGKVAKTTAKVAAKVAKYGALVPLAVVAVTAEAVIDSGKPKKPKKEVPWEVTHESGVYKASKKAGRGAKKAAKSVASAMTPTYVPSVGDSRSNAQSRSSQSDKYKGYNPLNRALVGLFGTPEEIEEAREKAEVQRHQNALEGARDWLSEEGFGRDEIDGVIRSLSPERGVHAQVKEAIKASKDERRWAEYERERAGNLQELERRFGPKIATQVASMTGNSDWSTLQAEASNFQKEQWKNERKEEEEAKARKASDELEASIRRHLPPDVAAEFIAKHARGISEWPDEVELDLWVAAAKQKDMEKEMEKAKAAAAKNTSQTQATSPAKNNTVTSRSPAQTGQTWTPVANNTRTDSTPQKHKSDAELSPSRSRRDEAYDEAPNVTTRGRRIKRKAERAGENTSRESASSIATDKHGGYGAVVGIIFGSRGRGRKEHGEAITPNKISQKSSSPATPHAPTSPKGQRKVSQGWYYQPENNPYPDDELDEGSGDNEQNSSDVFGGHEQDDRLFSPILPSSRKLELDSADNRPHVELSELAILVENAELLGETASDPTKQFTRETSDLARRVANDLWKIAKSESTPEILYARHIAEQALDVVNTRRTSK